ncbi:MAG: adenylosuccinate lyase [Candidatus Borkfalkiaceae bacterium]|nr:adenylosuccinate lyase [Christensenellaceae bacterium]
MAYDLYENPLSTRYAREEMIYNFSDEKKYRLWRKLWVVLAEAEHELGLNITKEQIDELKKYQDNVNYDRAKAIEKEIRHEVMAHIKAYGEQAKTASGIIHLGATSCYVLDNAEIIVIDDALEIVRIKLLNVINNLKSFALKYSDLPTLGYTHLQPAQLTTVGKRACLWLQDLLCDYDDLTRLKQNVKLRGLKGTTGTQASFYELFNGDDKKVKQLETLVVKKIGYKNAFAVTGQTYPRKFDYKVLSLLSQISQSAYKFANDLRILQSFKEMEEPFEKNQVGSSAMAYKRNPMRSERICALARYVISLPVNASVTASTQWMERTLDDSANKRITIAESFLAIDGILNLYMNVTENLVVYEKVIEKRVKEELPFMATENVLMEAVKAGGDRQILHEEIRRLSMQAAENVKINGQPNNLIELIKSDALFASVKDSIDESINPKNFIGMAPEQTLDFIENEVNPILDKNSEFLNKKSILKV